MLCTFAFATEFANWSFFPERTRKMRARKMVIP